MGDTAIASSSVCAYERGVRLRSSARHRVHVIFRCTCATCHAAVRAGLAGETPSEDAVKERWKWLVQEPAAERGTVTPLKRNVPCR